ncbi:MAG: hypothetical protein RL145_1025, partial [Pseudomonadota bacterium]
YHAPRPLFMVHPRKVSLAGMVVLVRRPLQSLRDSFPTSGEAASGTARSRRFPIYGEAPAKPVKGCFRKLRRGLVILPAHQTASFIVIGRFVASSPDFLRKSAAERREADLTRHIAQKQSRLAFGAGRACTKAFQTKKSFTGLTPCAANSRRSPLEACVPGG